MTPTSKSYPSIAITGATGQLGSQLCRRLGKRAIPLRMEQMDLTNPSQIASTIEQLRPDVLINTAAYTNVDGAEEKADLCRKINTEGVERLAEETRKHGCRLVQISTDYVFSAAPHPGRPFVEGDQTQAAGVYARSKADGELAAQVNPDHLVVRTCGIYGPECPNGTRNFVSTMLQLGHERDALDVVQDQICNPTYVAELADALLFLIEENINGVFHVVNQGELSWFDLAKETFRIAGVECEVRPISTADYNATAPRPAYSALDCSKYLALGGPNLSTCRGALERFLIASGHASQLRA